MSRNKIIRTVLSVWVKTGTGQAYVCLGSGLGVRGSGGQGKPVGLCHLVYHRTCLTDADAERLRCWEASLWNLPWSSEWPAQVVTGDSTWLHAHFSQLRWEPLNVGSVSTTLHGSWCWTEPTVEAQKSRAPWIILMGGTRVKVRLECPRTATSRLQHYLETTCKRL